MVKANHSVPIILHCNIPSIATSTYLGPSIIAQKLRTVTAAHRFEVNLRKMHNLLKNITQVWSTVRPVFKTYQRYLPDTTPVKHKFRKPGYWQHALQNDVWLKYSTGSVPRAINNHFEPIAKCARRRHLYVDCAASIRHLLFGWRWSRHFFRGTHKIRNNFGSIFNYIL